MCEYPTEPLTESRPDTPGAMKTVDLTQSPGVYVSAYWALCMKYVFHTVCKNIFRLCPMKVTMKKITFQSTS